MSYYGIYYEYLHNVGYYTLSMPIGFCTQNSVYTIKRNRVQGILCAVVHVLVLYETAVEIYTTSRQDIGSNVFRLVAASEQVTHPFFQCVFMYTSWFKAQLIGVYGEAIAEIQFPLSTEGREKQVRKIRVLSASVMVLCLFGFFSQELLRFAKSNCDLVEYAQHYAWEAELAYFPGATGALWYAQTLLHVLLRFPTYYTIYFAWSLMLVESLTMRHCLVDFLNACKGRGGMEPAAPAMGESQILWYYTKIKKVFKLLNEGFGYYFLAIVVLTVSYYPIWAGSFYFTDDGERPVKSVAGWCLFIWRSISLWGILTLCAEVNAKAGDFYDWIASRVCENSLYVHTHAGVHRDDQGQGQGKIFSPPSLNPKASVLAALTMDMNSCQIALKGTSMFSMTYGFLGSVVGVTLTYTIVIVQLHLQTH